LSIAASGQMQPRRRINRAHLQQPHAAMRHREALRDVIDAGVDGEESAERAFLRARAFFDQRVHLADRGELLSQLAEAERPGEARRRVGIDRQHVAAQVGVNLG
jgi:hypothetical protein